MYSSDNDLNAFLAKSDQLVLVEITSVHGSTPRNENTWMLVSEDHIFRTIGGGQLENLAIENARRMLLGQNTKQQDLQISLGPHTGQCCGGVVHLSISYLNKNSLDEIRKKHQEELDDLPHVYIFGAGHVGKALCRSMSLLPVLPILIDTREAELSSAPNYMEKRLSAVPEAEVRKAPSNSSFIILTHDHSLDFLIAREALMRRDTAYVGMIGSKTKRATFRNWLRRENGDESGIQHLTCPIGSNAIKDKRPEVIAAFVSAEIMAHLNEVELQENQPETTPSPSGIKTV